MILMTASVLNKEHDYEVTATTKTRRKGRFQPSPSSASSTAIILDMKLSLPVHVGRANDNDSTLLHYIDDDNDKSSTSMEHTTMSPSSPFSSTRVMFTLQVHRSRVLWHALHPLLFQTHPKLARRALKILLQECWEQPWLDTTRIHTTHTNHDPPENPRVPSAVQHHHRDKSACPETSTSRRLHIAWPNSKANTTLTNMKQPPVHRMSNDSVVWAAIFHIQPPTITPLEYTFSGLLIRWEHVLIRAQSLSGYIATLGGGFFLCHHFSTAIQLARQQQRLAILLNDENMYYACWIHQAYSHIYAGKFSKANAILRQVWTAITPSFSPNDTTNDINTLPSTNTVLHKMCRSARLFSKRMQKASQSKHGQYTKDDVSKRLSETIDDFKRIRLVQDKSKVDDLVIPFSKAIVRM